MTFRFLPQAQAELFEGIAYYAAIRPELGLRFEQAISEAIRFAVSHPERGAPRSRNTRRVLVKSFPFLPEAGVIAELHYGDAFCTECCARSYTHGHEPCNRPGTARPRC